MKKIVFLIDSDGDNCDKSLSQEITLIVVRLLAFFSSVCRQSQSESRDRDKQETKCGFRWGFKFFSSRGALIRSKLNKCKSHFYESYDRRCFERFQKTTESLLSNGGTEAETNFDKKKRQSLTHPSAQLSSALTEILHDFEWQDKDDLSKSPARLLRNRQHYSQSVLDFDENGLQNHVFILSKTPSSKQQLRQFSNKVVIDSDVFVDSFMSPALLNEYQEKSKIRLFWIDFNFKELECKTVGTVASPHEAPSADSLLLVKSSMKKLGGDLLHKNDILIESHNCKLSALLCGRHDHPIYLCPIEARLKSLIPSGLRNTETNVGETTVFVPGVHKLEMHGVKLTPINLCSNNSSSATKGINSDSAFPRNWESVEMIFQGCISSSSVVEIVQSLDVAQSCMLTCDLHSKMSLLLLTLVKTQSLGILKLASDKESWSPQMAVLSAVTSNCGHVFRLSWNQQINMETAVLFESLPQDKEKMDNENSFPEAEKSNKLLSLKRESEARLRSKEKEFNPQVLNSWHVPGSSRHINPLIKNLKQREESNQSLRYSLDLLKNLQASYAKTKHKQNSSVVTSTPVETSTPIEDSTKTRSGESSGRDSRVASTRSMSRKSSSSLSRGRLMVDKARSATLVTPGEEEGNSNTAKPTSPSTRRTSGSAGFENLNIKTEEELDGYLCRQYNQVLAAGVAMEASIQAMMTVTCYFMSSQGVNNPQKAAVAFIHQKLAVSSSSLKEKYGKGGDAEKLSQAVEYKLQVLLLLEMASFVTENEDLEGEKLVNAVVSLLRVLSFIIGPVNLRAFLGSTANSYTSTLPKVLMEVYDELDLPYPAQLARLASPSAPSTVWGANMSVGSNDSFLSGPGSSQPPSASQLSQGSRRSRLKQHPSLSDFRQKKQILVEKTSKPVTKSEGRKSAKDKAKQKPRSSKTRHGVEYGLAKRNLFSDKSKSNHSSKTRDKHQMTPKRKSGKPKVYVPSTPAHKQTSERMLSKQRRLREHYNIQPEVQVVAESPQKDGEDPLADVGDKPARFLLRESFYSSSSGQSRIVARSMELTERGESQPACSQRFLHAPKSQGSLSSAVRGESPILSPRTRFRKAFLPSPTPEAKSKGEKRVATTPTSHLPRRSPRKSVKKLLFQQIEQPNIDKDPKSKKPSGLSDAHLIFDGENASDALGCDSPAKSRSVEQTKGFKTPEKRIDFSSDLFESASCPPLQFTPTKVKEKSAVRVSELSFKNCFSSQGSSSNISDRYLKSANMSFMLAGVGKSNGRASHSFGKIRSMSGRLSSVASSTNDREKNDVKSPKKGAKSATRKFASFNSAESIKIPHGRNTVISNVKEAHELAEEDVIPSTPKKTPRKNSMPANLSTPSKVHFSESCLISPRSGSGHPVSTTPSKSILKGSPALKKASFSQRIDFTQSSCTSDLIQTASNSHTRTSRSTSLKLTPSKISSSSSSKIIKSLNYKNMTSEDLASRYSEAEEKSPIKIPIRKPKPPCFDDNSSSSNSCQAAERSAAVTVVTAHTPSPSNKCKTPDSINKWVRKKRLSGSKSSSSSVSPSSSSNESQEKVSGSGQLASASGSSFSASSFSVNQSRASISSPTKENALKRKLFSPERKLSEQLSPLGKKKRGSLNLISNTDKELSTAKEKGVHLQSYNSEGFSHSSHLDLIDREDPEASSPQKNSARISSSSDPTQSFSSQALLSSKKAMPSPAKKASLVWQDSCPFGEGSQGFLMESNDQEGDECAQPQTSPANREGSVSQHPPRTSQQQPSDVNSPNTAKSSPGEDRKFSPALSTSGLLQLIRSPLLEGQEKHTRASNKSTKSRSRKHLDWP